MSLGDIKRKLYQKEEEEGLSSHGTSAYDPHMVQGAKPETPAPDLWAEKKPVIGVQEKSAIKKGTYILAGVLAIILVIMAAYLYRMASFSSDRVTLAIVGSEQADSGRFLTYEINYKNNNQKELKNAQLKIIYPEDFKPENNANFVGESPTSGTFSIGSIPANGGGNILFNGRIYSPKGALVYLKAQLSYNPGSYSTRYTSEKQLGINVTDSPITLEIAAPQYVASGDEVNYLVSYKNDGERDLTDIKIKMEYPEGFVFSSADPKSFEGDNIWYIGTMSAGQTGKITVSGKLEGESDQVKNVKAYVGSTEQGNFVSFNESDASTKIIGSAITISQTVNGVDNLNANAGDSLRFNINYKNTGEDGLTNLLVTEKIESPVLDYSSMELNGGHFDSGNSTITWKASDHPELKSLEPGKGGKIEFSVKVKDSIPVANNNDKNFVISSVVKIDSPDIPTPISMNKIIAGNKIDIKLNSKLFLSVKGYHTDPNITNSGPVPPKVGEETTYTIHWIVSNINNDVNEARVEATLPTWAAATGQVYPEGTNITYNERDNTVVWEIGNMGAGTGVLSSPREATFQIKIKPSPDQVNKTIEILKSSVFKAKDAFTGDEISMTVKEKTTHLEEDSSLDSKDRVE